MAQNFILKLFKLFLFFFRTQSVFFLKKKQTKKHWWKLLYSAVALKSFKGAVTFLACSKSTYCSWWHNPSDHHHWIHSPLCLDWLQRRSASGPVPRLQQRKHTWVGSCPASQTQQEETHMKSDSRYRLSKLNIKHVWNIILWMECL